MSGPSSSNSEAFGTSWKAGVHILTGSIRYQSQTFNTSRSGLACDCCCRCTNEISNVQFISKCIHKDNCVCIRVFKTSLSTLLQVIPSRSVFYPCLWIVLDSKSLIALAETVESWVYCHCVSSTSLTHHLRVLRQRIMRFGNVLVRFETIVTRFFPKLY